MHPLYLVDFIAQIRSNLSNDTTYLRGGVDGIRAIENKYKDIELNWLITGVEREAHNLKHALFQLEKGLEKLVEKDTNASKPIQDNIQ